MSVAYGGQSLHGHEHGARAWDGLGCDAMACNGMPQAPKTRFVVNYSSRTYLSLPYRGQTVFDQSNFIVGALGSVATQLNSMIGVPGMEGACQSRALVGFSTRVSRGVSQSTPVICSVVVLYTRTS